jgi:hypothetical protein
MFMHGDFFLETVLRGVSFVLRELKQRGSKILAYF